MSQIIINVVNGHVRIVITDGAGGIAGQHDLAPGEAERTALDLLAAVRLVDRAEISSLRRDQQQILTALQEVARKTVKLDQLLAPQPMIHIGADISVNAAAEGAEVARDFAERLKATISGSQMESLPC